MQLFRKKGTKASKRQIFGFQCDSALVHDLKVLAQMLNSPIYVTCEHCLFVGINQVSHGLLDATSRARLQRHLVDDHLLCKALDEQHFHLDAMVGHPDIKLGQGELIKTILSVIGDFEEAGLSCGIATQMVRNLALEAQIRRDADFQVLLEIEEESGSISRILAVIDRFGIEEIRTQLRHPGRPDGSRSESASKRLPPTS
jgi:hypothetical protein